MKFPFVFLCLLGFLIPAKSQHFQNSLRSVKGDVTLLKELANGDILATIVDINLDSTYIIKLHSNGELYLSKSIGKSTDNLRFDNLYEYNGGYAFSFGKSEQSFTTTNEPFSEGFMFFDSNLVFKYQTEFSIHDTSSLRHEIYYDMNDNHVWFGMFHYMRPMASRSFFLKIFRFKPDGSFDDSTSLSIDSFISHYKFIKSFVEDSVYKMIVGYNNQLHTYSFSSNLTLIHHDSTSGYQFVNGLDTFYAILGDSGYEDIVQMRNGYITTNSATNRTGKIQLNVSKFNGSMVKNMLVPLPNSNYAFDFSEYYKNRISYKKAKIYIAANYIDSSVEYNYLAYIHQLDTELNYIKTWPIFNNTQQGGIKAITATEDGGCLVVGTTWSSFSGITIYLAKLDTNGILSFVTPVSPTNQNITLYPNPGNDFVHGIPEGTMLTLIDVSGKQISFQSNVKGIDVSEITAGIYFYQVVNKQGEIIATGKYLKQ